MGDSKRVQIESWSPVGIWSFDVDETDCLICRFKLTEKCIDCSSTSKNQDTRCSIAKGRCGHAFHHHCIKKSMETADTCPVDSTPWIFETANMNTSPWNKIKK